MMQPTPNETQIHTDELVDIREVSVDKNLPKDCLLYTSSGKAFYVDAAEILTRMELSFKHVQKAEESRVTFFRIGCVSRAEDVYKRQLCGYR